MKPGINMTVGGETFSSPTAGFKKWEEGLMSIKKELGDLTRPYDEISSELIFRIKRRFDDNTFGRAPYEGNRSRFTRGARTARGGDPEGPTLKDSGLLQDSIHRVPSATKTELGEQREVFILRIGTAGVSYATKMLNGGSWQVPTRQSPKGTHYLDVDRLPRSIMSNEEYWGSRWSQIGSYPEATKSVSVPARNFLALFPKDEEFITQVINQWLTRITQE